MQDATRQKKNDRWLDSCGVTRKHEAGKGTAREGWGQAVPQRWRNEEQQQKEEEGAGQRPKMKNGEQEGDAKKKKPCSMTEEKRIGAGTQTKRDEKIEWNRHGESSSSVMCYGAEKKGLESRDKEPDRKRQSKNTDRLWDREGGKQYF